MNHDIFRTPHQVALTLLDRATPEQYASENLGATMPMWRVQTEGYTDGQDQLIGVVSRNVGFLDSPDTEWISSGVNSKNSQAVALGRHGNFFHWGFAVSPTYLTEEAKLVFVNAVHYIARFDHEAPIARKRQGNSTRESVRSSLERITAKGYADTVAMYARFAEQDKQRKAAVRARIDAGQAVADDDRRMLDRPPMQIPGRFEPVRRYFTDAAWAKVADDERAITAALVADLPYMHSHGWYEMVVDEDLKRFGVANDDMALLDKAIAAWAAGKDAQLARTLLERYTNETFASAAEWTAWLAHNRDRLFFTESGGYKWLVDTTGSAAQARASQKGSMRKIESRSGSGQATRSATSKLDARNPVAAKMILEPLGDDVHALAVQVEIRNGWHAYGPVPPGSPYTAMTVELRLPDGVRRVGDWQVPKGNAYPAEPGLTVFEGKVVFRCKLTGKLPADVGKLVCVLGYQVCDESMCQPPTTKELTADTDGAEER